MTTFAEHPTINDINIVESVPEVVETATAEQLTPYEAYLASMALYVASRPVDEFDGNNPYKARFEAIEHAKRSVEADK